MERSRVYDKMRLFLQREGQADTAVGYGIASHFSRALALHKQKRFDELEDFISRDTLEEVVRRLLKGAKMSESHATIVELLEPTRNNVNRCNPQSLIRKVCRAIGAPSEYEAEQ